MRILRYAVFQLRRRHGREGAGAQWLASYRKNHHTHGVITTRTAIGLRHYYRACMPRPIDAAARHVFAVADDTLAARAFCRAAA